MSGESHKYQEWKANIMALLRLDVGAMAGEWVGWAQIQNHEVGTDDIGIQFGETSTEVEGFAMTLHSELLGTLVGWPFTE